MTTRTFLFKNNAVTTLAAPISPSSTSLTVASGGGSLFPAPNARSLFAITLEDAATHSVREVIYCQARSGNTFSQLLRGQEGTAAASWIAGDTVAQYLTAGQMTACLQRTQLLGNLNIYVNGLTGSDSNGGLSPSDAFATFNFAWNFLLQNYDLNGFTVTINQAGTNNDTLSANGMMIGGVTASSVILNINGTWAVTAGSCLFGNGSSVTVQGSGTVSATGTGIGQGYAILAFANSQINYGGVTFGTCGVAHVGCTQNGQVTCTTDYTIAGNAPTHLLASQGGSMTLLGHTVTLTGTPSFSGAFATAANCGVINSNSTTFSGGATGSRYAASKNGSIDTSGAGSNYFPGNASGSTAAGGQYN